MQVEPRVEVSDFTPCNRWGTSLGAVTALARPYKLG